MKRILFIYNPKAGKTSLRNKLADAVEILSTKYIVTTYPTKAKKDATKIVGEMGNHFDLIVCAGGDGTLDEVVQGVVDNHIETPIAYIPCGITNDVATSIGLSKNIEDAARNIVNGKVQYYDYGKFNNSIFVYVAAFGLLTNVTYETNQELKNTLGHFAYVLNGIKSLSETKPYHLHIKHDEGEIEGDFILGLVSSSKSIGGFNKVGEVLGKEIALDDGLFEVVLVKQPKTIEELNSTITALSQKDLMKENSWILSFSTSKLVIESDEKISWTLDGEFGGEHDFVSIENVNRGLKLVH